MRRLVDVLGVALVLSTVACGQADLGDTRSGNPLGGPGGSAEEAKQASVSACGAEVKIQATVLSADVYLIIDRSGSMETVFEGGVSRWNALRDTLIGPANQRPGGLIANLQSKVQFGFAMYQGTDNKCPSINPLAAKSAAYEGIRSVYAAAEPGGSTPTGEALETMLDFVKQRSVPLQQTVFLLATDGQPNRCQNNNNPPSAAERSVNAVKAAYSVGVRTFVLGVGEVTNEHLQDLANAGVNAKKPNDAPYFRPSSRQQLEKQLESMVAYSSGCVFELKGEISDLDRACTGTVKLFTNGAGDGRTLECNGADGWRATDSKHIELLGKACTDISSDAKARVEGSFPCSVGRLL